MLTRMKWGLLFPFAQKEPPAVGFRMPGQSASPGRREAGAGSPLSPPGGVLVGSGERGPGGPSRGQACYLGGPAAPWQRVWVAGRGRTCLPVAGRVSGLWASSPAVARQQAWEAELLGPSGGEAEMARSPGRCVVSGAREWVRAGPAEQGPHPDWGTARGLVCTRGGPRTGGRGAS